MKAVGEVMSIADSFEMGLMKAVRGAEIKQDTLRYPDFADMSLDELKPLMSRAPICAFSSEFMKALPRHGHR